MKERALSQLDLIWTRGGNAHGGCQKVAKKQIVVLDEALGVTRRDAGREVRREPVREPLKRLLWNGLPTREPHRRTQRSDEPCQRALILEPGQTRRRGRLDQQKVGEERVCGKELESGTQAVGDP